MQNYRRLVFSVCILTFSIAASLEANNVRHFAGSEKTLDNFIIDLGRNPEIKQNAVTAIKEMNVSDDKILLAWAKLSLLLSRSGMLEDNTDHWLRTTDAVFGLIDIDKTSAGVLDTLKSYHRDESALGLDSLILQLGDENPQIHQDAAAAIKDMNVSHDQILLAYAKVLRFLGGGGIGHGELWHQIEDAVFRLIDLDAALVGGLLPLLKSANKDEAILARFVINRIVYKLRSAEITPFSDTALLLAESFKDPNAEIRETASRLLEVIPAHAEAAVPNLIVALNDENQDVQTAAVAALGDIAAAVPEVQLEIAERLIQLLNTPNFLMPTPGRGPCDNFHVWIALHLQSIGPAAVPLLVEAMDATDPGVRHHAAIALAVMGSEHDEATIPILIEALASPHPDTQIYTIYSFLFLAKRQRLVNQILHALVQVLDSTDDTVENRVARPMAASTLDVLIAFSFSHLEEKSRTPLVNPETKLEIVEKLIAALNTPNFETGLFERGRSSNFHLDVIGALEASQEIAVPLLVEAMDATDAGVRHHAAIALEWIRSEHDEAIIPILADALTSPHLHTRKEAVRALTRLAERAPLVDEITPIFLNVLETTLDTDEFSYDMTFHNIVAGALTDINPPAAIELLQSENSHVQELAATAIAYDTILEPEMVGPEIKRRIIEILAISTIAVIGNQELIAKTKQYIEALGAGEKLEKRHSNSSD